MTDSHADKYAAFLRMIDDAKNRLFDTVLVSHPSVLGDNYDEIVTNLGLLADAGLALRVVR